MNKTIGKIVANGVAAYVAGVAYEKGRAHAPHLTRKNAAKVAATWTPDRLGAAFGNLFAERLHKPEQEAADPWEPATDPRYHQ